jgi:hypothetical protein
MTNTRDRFKSAAVSDKMTKKRFVKLTGFSEHQWYSWFGDGKEQHSPSVEQTESILDSLGWSALYIYHDLGPYRLNDLMIIIEAGSEIIQHRQGALEHREVSLNNYRVLKRLETRVEMSGISNSGVHLKEIETR